MGSEDSKNKADDNLSDNIPAEDKADSESNLTPAEIKDSDENKEIKNIEDVFEKIINGNEDPKEIRKKFEALIQFQSRVISGPSIPDYSRSITSEHITTIIESEIEGTKLHLADRKHKRLFFFICLLSMMIFTFLIVLLFLRYNHIEMVDTFLKYFLGLGAGVGGSSIITKFFNSKNS